MPGPAGFARPWFDLPFIKDEPGIPPHHTAVLPIVVGHAAARPAAVPKNEAAIVCWHWDK